MTDIKDATQVTTRELVDRVDDLRRAESQLARRLSLRRAPNDTDREAMRFISEAPADSPATPGDLAAHLNVSTAAVTSILRRLQEREQVVVAPHPQDARSKVLRPSLRDANAPVDDLTQRIEDIASEFTPEQSDVVSRFLRRLTEEISDLS
ncbi:MarR family winged helix-turn-helix transcriptional regulator [Microbacterium hydrocarbonoxydans]|uniref:MarR family winged helix-turn-helix transcriptional regulator n=1 Tax=Microbacterium hydrocarbonoxydans TaxID=273678 RepID=UPI00203F81A2|nr:MarR family transcriptional regulator [Microbacterium hydrocarbonoxydans]MCM3778360.1 MarR family transcriptional regulator [Microbacterium hydrocarbonoxydans]